MKPSLRVLWSLLLLGGSALASQTPYSGPPAYDHEGVTVTVEQIFLKGSKLWVRLNVINHGHGVLVIDKNQIQAQLGDGRSLGRAMGTFGHNAQPANLMPGMAHALYVEYEIGKQPQPVTLRFDRGFYLDGKPVALPPYALIPLGGR